MLDGLCRLLHPRHIVLVGARDAALAQAMLDAAMREGAVLHVIAEAPGEALRALRGQGGDACVLHDAPAAAALALLPVPGLCWVDADPNWHTTQAILGGIEAQASRLNATFPVVVVQGAGWPYGRRDGYDDPAAIPEGARHPHERAGLLPGQAMPAGAGGLYADRYHATAENEPRLGVLTAAEDFMEGRSAALRSVVLPGFGGLVGISPRTGAGAQAFSPSALSAYLRETAEALETVRLDQAIALAAAEAELRRAKVMIDLLRGDANGAQPASELSPAALAASVRARLRPAVRLARRVVARARQGKPEPDAALERLRASPVMDGGWYLERYPDVAAAGLDPAEHYLRSGAAELRDPGPHFSSSAYLLANPDVAEAGLNPLLHYLLSGAAEGRNPGGDFDGAAYLAAHPRARDAGANPLEHFISGTTRG
jgi:hypothetical protein